MAYSNTLLKLRLELKEWEREFAATHDGRKPSREEVKTDKTIAAKYKQYSKLRASTAAELDENTKVAPTSTSKNQREEQTAAATPRKSTKSIPWEDSVYESPVSVRQQRLFGNRTRDSVGPTPQKNGKVLGLFETFMNESSPVRKPLSTPSGTPTKTVTCVSASPAGQDAFTTPKKRKFGDLNCSSPSKPHHGNSPGMYATPPFLRQDKSRLADSENSPPIPRPLAPPKRGLSSILAELRDMEDHAFDDEEEAMRDMEIGPEDDRSQRQGSSKLFQKSASTQPKLELEPELPPPPPGAFSEERMVETATESIAGTRVWKKKGLKRQTRRVIMRPVKAKKSQPDTYDGQDNGSTVEDEESGSESDGVSEFSGSGHEDNTNVDAKRAKRIVNEDVSAAKKGNAEKTVGKCQNIVKKAVRKVSATAHANFRKLNIRNKNSKGKGGGGRFYKRRR